MTSKVTLTIETSQGTETYTQETDRYGKFVLPLVFSCVKSAIDRHKGEFEIAASAVQLLADFAGICTPAEHEHKPAETKNEAARTPGTWTVCPRCEALPLGHEGECEPANS